MRLPVLLYHHVGPQDPGIFSIISVSPEGFERHVRWLARQGYQGITASDWLRWRREGKGLPQKPILLTFDDGYEDLVKYAFPVLRRYGFGAVVYIVTGRMGGTNTWDEAYGFRTLRLMTTEQVRYWATQGIEFGCHSRTHPDLRRLSAEGLADEVRGSAQDLASILGARAVSFAYPYGYYNDAVCDCVRGDFDLAFVAPYQGGMNHLQTDPHRLLRTEIVANDSVLAIACSARWGFNPFRAMKRRIPRPIHRSLRTAWELVRRPLARFRM